MREFDTASQKLYTVAMILEVKPQFKMSSVFLSVTFLAIGMSGILAQIRYIDRIAGSGDMMAICSVPMWIPFAFAGFIVGRRAISVKTVITFAIAQAASLLAFYLLMPPLV